MKGTGIFYINGEKLELPLFEKGDRVRPTADSTIAVGAEGTVVSTRVDGLFVDVQWDQKAYLCSLGGTVELGSGRMVDGLELIK